MTYHSQNASQAREKGFRPCGTSRSSSRREIDSKPEKSFSLFNLPIEVFNLFLSYIIEIPWHPEKGVFNLDTLIEFCPPEVFHVNRSIRQRSLDVVCKNVLWIELKCSKRRTLSNLQGMKYKLPLVPLAYRELLPLTIQKVSFELGDPNVSLRTTRTVTNESAVLLFPFNYDSIAVFSSSIMACVMNTHQLAIRTSQLSTFSQRIVDQRVMLQVRLFHNYFDIDIFDWNGEYNRGP